MWALRVKTYEYQSDDIDEPPVLVLEHVFVGASKSEALGYSRSHAKTDGFYKESGGAKAASYMDQSGRITAVVRGKFKGVQTISFAKWEQC